MNIDFNKINEIYGEDIIVAIKDNIDDVKENISYLEKLRFNDIEDIFERYTLIFIDTPSSFKDKINQLINKLGNDYVNIIENDLSVLEELF